MGLVYTLLIVALLNVASVSVTVLLMYRYNLLPGVDYRHDPKWLKKFRKESRWEKVQ